MSHLNVTKLRGQFFKRTQQSKRIESCLMCSLDLCIQLLLLPKDHVKSLSEQNYKKINSKNIKMKPPVALFKTKSRKLCLFLKAKSQNLIILYVVCIKKTVKRKICKFFKNNLFYFLFEFQE